MRTTRIVTCMVVGSLTALIVAACGSSGGGQDGFNTSPDSGSGAEGGNGVSPDSSFSFDAATIQDSAFDPDAFFASDPPPQWCGADGGATPPPVPGGTPDCPDDKNRQGCPCPTAGATAPCWPGHRANRNHGQCHDGTTTCVQSGEFNKSWGACVGYTLPDPNAKLGKAACKCFSAGQWAIANLSPCFADSGGGPGSGGATSTYQDAQGNAQCAQGAPTAPWSTDTLKVDCAGHFKLCYELKAGNSASPQASDCSIAKDCVEGDYPTANVVTPFPNLPAWSATNTACAKAFATTGGYGEMSVVGLSVECDQVDDGSGNPYVFSRVPYCPLSCNSNPSGAGCQGCGQGGSGGF